MLDVVVDVSNVEAIGNILTKLNIYTLRFRFCIVAYYPSNLANNSTFIRSKTLERINILLRIFSFIILLVVSFSYKYIKDLLLVSYYLILCITFEMFCPQG